VGNCPDFLPEKECFLPSNRRKPYIITVIRSKRSKIMHLFTARGIIPRESRGFLSGGGPKRSRGNGGLSPQTHFAIIRLVSMFHLYRETLAVLSQASVAAGRTSAVMRPEEEPKDAALLGSTKIIFYSLACFP
jgi:hypothetical protein